MKSSSLSVRLGSLALLLMLLFGSISPLLTSAQSTPEASPSPEASPTPTTNIYKGGRINNSIADTAADEVTPAEQALAEKFRPILNMTAQENACDKSGDPYFPTTVDWIMNNPDVLLRSSKDKSIISTGFTAQDLAVAGTDTYLDFPGNPREPKCTFEQYFLAAKEQYDLKPTTYAHFYYDAAENKLWLSYWFYYYFNDWNDTHESDWEMMMLAWNTLDPEQAIKQPPSFIGYAQHGGGETTTWTSDKLSKQDDRVLAYASAGSHATYYTESTYIGWGENGTAFGCDKTLAPYNQYDLDVIVIPSRIDPDGPFAWALYEGRWGEKQTSVYNGPYGPNMGAKWNEPSEAVQSWRDSSLKVPSSKTLGPSTTDLFCELSKQFSRIGTYLGAHLGQALLIILGILIVVGFLFSRIWSYFLEAIDIYGFELRTFLGIGLLCIPIGIVFNLLLTILINQPPLDWINKWFNGSGGRATGAAVLGGFQQLTMVLIISPIVVYAMKQIRDDEDLSVRSAIVGGVRAIPRLAITLLVTVVVILFFVSAVIGIPVAIFLAILWQFFAQAQVLDGEKRVTDALGASARVVRGNWWRAFGLSVGFQMIGLIPGPLIGILILIVGGSKVEFANLVSSFLYAIFVPISVIGLTMAYHRLKGDDIERSSVRRARRRTFFDTPEADTPPPAAAPSAGD